MLYSSGRLAGITEEWVGEWMADKPRDSLIIATKVAGAANGWFVPPIHHGLTAMDLILSEDILTECDKVHEEILYPMG